jgi:hypothetical protein
LLKQSLAGTAAEGGLNVVVGNYVNKLKDVINGKK